MLSGWMKGYRDLWHYGPIKVVGELNLSAIHGGVSAVPVYEAVDKASCGTLVRGHEAFESVSALERTCVACRRASLGISA